MGHPEPTVRKKRLGSALRRLREEAGVSQQLAGEQVDGDKSKMSRIESGRQGVRPIELKALLDLYGVDDDLRTALLTLQRQGRQQGWWHKHSETLTPELKERLSLESDAARIHAFQCAAVPGLLQTDAYAEAMIRGAIIERTTEEEVRADVELRLERQSIFDEDAPTYLCILTEAVLHQVVGGPEVMAEQLRALAESAVRPGTTVQVIPFAQGAFPAMDHPYTIYSYPDPMQLDIVGIENLDGALYLEEPGSVELYRSAFDHARAAALSSRESVALISRLARDLEKSKRLT